MTDTNTSITIFNNSDASAVMYFDKKGNGRSVTAEGALFLGGAALASLKDAAIEAAMIKAHSGRYRAASDILCAAFPAVGRKVESVIGTTWANKTTMGTLISGVMRAKYKATNASGKLTKQSEARMLCNALLQLPAFADVASAKDIIEAVEADQVA